MYHQTEEQFYSWLAGLIDGDGCFSIAPQRPNSAPFIRISFSIAIGLKAGYEFVLAYVHTRTGIVHIYKSNQGKPNEIIRWQTTNLENALVLTNRILPYLVLKREKAIKFLTCAQFCLDTKVINRNRQAGTLRTNSDMKTILKAAIELNYDRQ
ncbi:MAG: LAGLIDADG family homing endonuclease, partial [Patescibacteria group bacterium]